jgi:Ca-activated chloride channel family protein
VAGFALLGACGVDEFLGGGLGSPAGGSEFGATTGGVKDLGLARALIQGGQVPSAAAFLVEGAFAEQDLPLLGAACARTLCLRGALGVAPQLDGAQAGWVQVGMSSNIDPQAYVRPSLTIIATVDVSGSMGWDYRSGGSSYPSGGALSYRLLKELAARLQANDRVALVEYGDTARLVLDFVPGNDPRFLAAIESLRTTGSTNMEAGLKLAYQKAAQAVELRATQQHRVMLFTDEQPNVGATSETEFQRIVGGGAAQGVGLTVFGMGPGLGQSLLVAMSKLRGGNGFTLTQLEDVPALMADSWPWMASPLAYDLKVELTPQPGFGIGAGYGFPAAGGTAQLEASTVFLSRRKGGLLVRLDPLSGQGLTGLGARGQLRYTDLAGQAVTEPLAVDYTGQALDPRGTYFEQRSVGKAVAVAIAVSAMKRAAELYGTDHGAAIKHLDSAMSRLTADDAALAAQGDTALAPLLQMAKDLLALMQKGAAQGDLYGR